jgi:hypothetical protein
MIQLASIVFSHATLESDETRRVNKNMKLLMDGLIFMAKSDISDFAWGEGGMRGLRRCDTESS